MWLCLKDKDGYFYQDNEATRPWKTQDGNPIPTTCPTCGSTMVLYLRKERPVFRCAGKQHHYIGPVTFPH